MTMGEVGMKMVLYKNYNPLFLVCAFHLGGHLRCFIWHTACCLVWIEALSYTCMIAGKIQGLCSASGITKKIYSSR